MTNYMTKFLFEYWNQELNCQQTPKNHLVLKWRQRLKVAITINLISASNQNFTSHRLCSLRNNKRTILSSKKNNRLRANRAALVSQALNNNSIHCRQITVSKSSLWICRIQVNRSSINPKTSLESHGTTMYSPKGFCRCQKWMWPVTVLPHSTPSSISHHSCKSKTKGT